MKSNSVLIKRLFEKSSEIVKTRQKTQKPLSRKEPVDLMNVALMNQLF
jgi:hypothetical protein